MYFGNATVLRSALLLVGVVTALGSSLPTIRLRDQNGQTHGAVDMPVIAAGTGGYDNSTAEDAVAKAMEAGINHVHCAYDYFNLPGVGRGLGKAKRSDVFISAMTSPCIHTAAPPQRNISDPDACFDLTTRELNEVLELLDVDHVDLMMLHGPSEPFGYQGPCDETICAVNRAQWRAYENFMRAGKAAAIGVSNYCQSCLACLAGQGVTVVPAVNQVQWHVGMGGNPEGLMSYCNSQNIVVQAYGPLASGAVATDPLCADVGKAYNKSAAQVGLRWILQHQATIATAIVVKADDLAYLNEDKDIFNWTLTPDDMSILSSATSPTGQQDGRPSWGCAM